MVDFGGITRKANISLVEAEIDDYIIVHAGYAIQVMDQEEAKKTLETWEEFLQAASDIGS